MSIFTGVVSSDFKVTKVIPIFIKGDKSECSNYRPISMLNIFNKILEKLVYTRVVSFLKKIKKIIYTYQFGFRSNHSANLALISVFDKLYDGLDEGELAIGVYLDIEKAFDCINYEIFLDKLQYYGIRRLHGNGFPIISRIVDNTFRLTIITL